ERAGMREAVIAALGRTQTVTRGPKPVKALKEIGLAPSKVAAAPTTDGIIAALRDEPLRGRTVGVQLYSESNLPLSNFLEDAGATVRTVSPYVYAPASDADQVVQLVDRMADGQIDAVVFTSSPQVDRLFEVAKEHRLQMRLRDGFLRTKVAAVGPVVADNLQSPGARVDICPEQGVVMKNLVLHIKRDLST